MIVIRSIRSLPLKYWGAVFVFLSTQAVSAANGFTWRANVLDEYALESDKSTQLRIDLSQCQKALDYSISDVTGHEIFSGRLPQGVCQPTIPMNLGKGHYRVTIDGVSRGIYSLPKRTLPDYFGVDAALTHIVKEPERRSQYISLLGKVGIGVVRERLIWNGLSPGRGEWNGPSNVDSLRAEYKKANIRVLEAVQTSLTKDYDFPAPEKFKSDFSSFYSRWGSEWMGVEPWNEPNHRKFTDRLNDVDRDSYVDKYVAYATQAAGAIGDKVKIVNGALAGNPGANADFSKKLLLRRNFFSANSDLSFHTYTDAGTLIRWLSEYEDWLRGQNFAGKLWITESGWVLHNDDFQTIDSDNQEAATQIAAKSIVAYSSGVKHYFSFVLPFYKEKDGQGRVRYFGLTDKEGSPTLSLVAYVQAAQVLAEAKQENVEIVNSNHGFRVLIPSAQRIVIAVYDKTRVDLPNPTGALYAEGLDGRKIQRTKGGNSLPNEKLIYFYFPQNQRTAAVSFFKGGAK